MKKLASLISLLCVLNILVIAGLGAYLWGTGRLDKAKAQAIGDMLKQKGTPAGFREKVYDLIVPVATTATAPGTQPAVVKTDEALTPATAAERIDYLKKTLEAERLTMESERQGLRHAQELLAKSVAELEEQRTKLQQDKKIFEARLAAANQKKDGAGFEKTMTVMQELKPKQVKDLLMGMQPEEAEKYLAAMEPERAAKIIGEFKDTKEVFFINGVIDQMRGAGQASAASGTGAALGTTDGGGALSPSVPATPSAKAGS